MASPPRFSRRPLQPGGSPPKDSDTGAPRASSILLGMLVVALIGLLFALALTLVSATD